MKIKKLSAISLLIFSSLATGGWALAGDTGIEGFNGIFFKPNTDGQGILNVDKANLLPKGTMHVGSYFQYARRTISFSDPLLGGLVTDLAENQVMMNFITGVGLFDFLDAGMDIPIILMQNGTRCNDAACSSVTNYTGRAIGDIRFVVKLQLMRDERSRVGIALASDVGLPTGNRTLFTGGKGPSYEQRLIVSKGFKHAELAANMGYRAASNVNAIGVNYGDMFTFGAAAKAFLPREFHAFATVSGARLIRDGGSSNTPVEFMAGAGHRWKNGVTCELGGGTHLSDGIMTADYRAIGSCGIDFDPFRRKGARQEIIKDARPPEEWRVPFGTGQSRLRMKQTEVLDDVNRWLAADRGRRVEITGSADDRAPYDYNMKLSTYRALSVRDYLMRSGVPPEQLVIQTRGESTPLSPGKTAQDRELNRSLSIREVNNQQ